MVSFRGIAMTPRILWSFACAVQHSIRLIARLAEIVITDFIRILLVGRGKGMKLVYC